ncbi:DUF6415 family natural product biosynthesis protein [Streptomyces sp. 8N616]|uniref:DUF6415 family natural product biosynthesis protein n=1 Tax=Streptomyces sp. 8N616 TaxID=3457414 RepID=UPI003FD4AE90
MHPRTNAAPPTPTDEPVDLFKVQLTIDAAMDLAPRLAEPARQSPGKRADELITRLTRYLHQLLGPAEERIQRMSPDTPARAIGLETVRHARALLADEGGGDLGARLTLLAGSARLLTHYQGMRP